MAVVEVDVIVDVGSRELALWQLETARGQRLHARPIERLERLASGAGQFLETPSVELLQQLGDRIVELGQREECAVAKASEDPTLRDQNSGLHLGLALWFARRRGDSGDPVVLRELIESVVDLGVVPIGSTARYLAPVVLTVFWVSRFATARAYDIPGTDWYELGARLEKVRARGDVVAVFPGYFAAIFRRYTRIEELAPVTFPSDLERVLARGKRVLLVVNGGRYFGNIDAYLALGTRGTPLFESQVRDTLRVLSLSARRRRASAIVAPNPESLLFTGLMGSGGFPWQGDPTERPFSRLKALLSGSRFVFTDFEAYHPQRLARLFIGSSEARGLVVGPGIASTLHSAGFSDVLLDCDDPDCDPDSRVLEAAGLGVVANGLGEGADGDAPEAVYTLPYRAGWRAASLDTSAMRGSARTIRLTLHTNGTHFPVAIDARIIGDHH